MGASNQIGQKPNKAVLQRIAEFAVSFEQILLEERRNLGLSLWQDLRCEKLWWVAVKFVLDKVFPQGRRDSLSERFEKATIQALEGYLGDTDDDRTKRIKELHARGWLLKERWNPTDNPLCASLSKKYEVNGKKSSTGKGRDWAMVRDVLRFATELGLGSPRNIINHIAGETEKGNLRKVYTQLLGLEQLGPKVTSLLLRDTVHVLSLEKHLDEEDLALLQPVDTWVRRLIKYLQMGEVKDGEIPSLIIQACGNAGVNPIRFNMGAWYLGSHSFDVLLNNIARVKP